MAIIISNRLFAATFRTFHCTNGIRSDRSMFRSFQVRPPSLWTWAATPVPACTAPVQRSPTYRHTDPPCIWQEVKENSAPQVPWVTSKAVRLVGPVWSKPTVSQTPPESVFVPQWTEGIEENYKLHKTNGSFRSHQIIWKQWSTNTHHFV